MRRKGDAFLAFLVAGLVIIVILLAFFNVYSWTSRPPYTPTPPGPEEYPNITEVEQGWVGLRGIEDYRTIAIGELNTSYLSGKNIIHANDKNLFSGILFGSNKLLIDVTRPHDFLGAYIEFDVVDTNNYGALMIKLHGTNAEGNDISKLIEAKEYHIGHHKITISDIPAEATIEIAPESSAWKIWAANTYYLRNISVVVESLSLQPQQFSFVLYDIEYKNMTRAYLNLELEEREGRLIIDLNGNEVYNDVIDEGSKMIPIYKSALQKGNNAIEFRAEQNALFIGKASLIIYYSKQKDLYLSTTFDINSSRYANLDSTPGKVIVNITQVTRDGGFSLRLNNENLCLRYTCYPSVDEKAYSFRFKKGEAKIGNNVLELRAIDNALFFVKNMTVIY